MKDIIHQIIDMDKEARRTTEDARQHKIEAEKEIEQRAKELRTDYLERTRRHMQIAAENERTIAEQKWKRKEATYRAQKKRLQKVFDEQGESLADELVARVLRGDIS